jgi:ketosteroid isomerase-like protein
MINDDPVALDREFERLLNAGDLDALMALYEPGAALMPMPGSVVVGAAAVREALAGFIAMKPTIRTSGRLVAQTGDLALLANDWTLDATGQDGKPVTMSGSAIEVARRQPQGHWLFALDMPFGAAK